MDKRFEVHCELCSNHIGFFEVANLALPLSGAMFETIGEGYAPPFQPTAPWEAFFCPRCRNRAIIEPNRIKTEKGYLSFDQGKKGLNFTITECDDPVTEAEILAESQLTYSALITIHDGGIIILPQEVVANSIINDQLNGQLFVMEIEEDQRIILHHKERVDLARGDEPADQESALDDDEAGDSQEGTSAPEDGDKTEGSEALATGDGSDNDPDEGSGLDVVGTMLLGSNLLPAMIELPDGKDSITLGEVVSAVQEKSGLSVEEWNGMDEGERDKLLVDEVELLQAIPNTHILWNKKSNDAHLVDGKIVTGSKGEVEKVMYTERPKGIKGLIVDLIEDDSK